MKVQDPFALFNITLFFDNFRLRQGRFLYNPNVGGEDLIQISSEMQGLPQVSKVDPDTVIHSLSINPTLGSETYRFLEQYVLKYVYSKELNFEKTLLFNDGMKEITSSHAFILPPDEINYESLASEQEFRIIFYNATLRSLG